MADNKRDHLNDMLIEYAPMINLHVSKLKKAGLPPHVDENDLYSHGMHGLIDAFHKYDPNRGVSFQTYASRRISGKMIDHIKSSGGVDNYHYQQAKKFLTQQKTKPENSEE